MPYLGFQIVEESARVGVRSQLLLAEGLRRRSTPRRGKQAAAIRHTADEFLLSTRADVLLFRSGNHVSRFILPVFQLAVVILVLFIGFWFGGHI